MNILFVCTMNRARSRAAEQLYRRTPGISVRSAGISERATHQVDEADLLWADRVIVFETAHEQWIREKFSGDLPEITDLGIPDDFTNADDPELITELRAAIEPLFGPPGRA
jgi:predicted protein tyrosine phosphatase